MRKSLYSYLVSPMIAALGFGVSMNTDFKEALSQDFGKSRSPYACASNLQSELKGQNKDKWETSFSAESDVICNTAHKNANHFEKAGLSQNEAELATFSAWLQLKKTDHSFASVSSADLEGVVRQFGLLIVNSEPPEADVMIDDKPCSTSTECRYWTSAGPHDIVISKKGYQTERTQETVTNGRTTRIAKTLRH
jgi:hypothetical protein